jgi:O-antigen ligase
MRERVRRGGASALHRAIVTGAVATNFLFISMSRSRASLVVLGLTLVLYSFLRRSRLAAAVAVLIGLVALASPSLAGGAARDAIFKGREGGSSFDIRADQLRATFDAAASRPISGYGFGTTRGETSWDGSLSSLSTGREKENAYVAAVEEVGLVGAVPLWFAIGAALVAGYHRARRSDDPAPAALLMVVTAGAVHTNFEAWLMAIGSFEAFIFWATMGVMLAPSGEPASRSLVVR